MKGSGYAYCLPATNLQREFNRNGAFQKLLLRYTLALITQVAQTAACNRHHSIKQQFCRWLLLSLDRRTDNKLPITQALIAESLGVRREGISDTAIMLQEFGVIAYVRGAITVLDRRALEKLSCECCAAVKGETDRLLTASPSSARSNIQFCPAQSRELSASLLRTQVELRFANSAVDIRLKKPATRVMASACICGGYVREGRECALFDLRMGRCEMRRSTTRSGRISR